ncbi:MAG: hypothetical protein QME42_05470 [bacterium]|nr:hypothetical protein [bacterium]
MNKNGKEQGVILLLINSLITILFILAMSFYVLVKGSHSQAILEDSYSVALPLAEAGAERAIWHLTQDPSWRVGYGDPNGDGEPFYYPNSNKKMGEYWVTLNTVGQTSEYFIIRITAWANVKAPRLFGVGTGLGATKKIEELVKVYVNVKPVGPHYAIMTGGKLSLNANSTIYGSIRSNGNIEVGARTDIYPDPYYHDGRVLTYKDIMVNAGLGLHDTDSDLQDVRARGSIVDQSKITGTSDGIFQYDMTSDTDEMINNGAIEPGADGIYIPNPGMTEILSLVTETRNETVINDNFYLNGGVYLFPNGIEFTKKIIGPGTIIVTDNNNVVFSTPLGTEKKPVEMNIIVINGTDGVIGTGDIYFNQNAHIKGLVYCHDNIISGANFSVAGAVISYKGELVFSRAHSQYTLNPFFPANPPGFSEWWDPTGRLVGGGGNKLVILSWKEVI